MRLAVMLACVLWAAIAHADIEMYGDVSTMIGLWAESYDDARVWLEKEHQFPLTITLRNGNRGEGGEEISYTIPTIEDLPVHNVPVACPSGKNNISRCWFIKYGDQW